MPSLDFAKILNLKVPLVVAPMAGGPSTPALVIATSEAGALGSLGGAYSTPPAIESLVAHVRSGTNKPFALNLFIPHETPRPSEIQIAAAIKATRIYRQHFGLADPDVRAPFEEDFAAQFETLLRLRPAVFSFIFGVLKPNYVEAAKREKILLVGTATNVEEALALQASGVDAMTLQGFEAGGHRGLFEARGNDPEISLADLVKRCRPKIHLPLIAAGGIMSSVDVKAAFANGADAVQMGTAFLACEEAGTSPPYRRALTAPSRRTKTTRVFSGRLARGIENRFMLEMEKQPEAILPFPAQNKFTRDLRTAALKSGTSDFLSLWSGTGKGSLWTGPASELIAKLF